MKKARQGDWITASFTRKINQVRFLRRAQIKTRCKMNELKGRCPKCGEIYRFRHDTKACSLCHALLKKKPQPKEKENGK